MRLSVIIPAYNREQTIAETVRSVLECGVDAEVVVVDDGSTDRTVEIVRALPVKLIEQANAGPSVARNTGFAHSSGEVIAFLDSDDVWLPGVIPDCVRTMRDYTEIDVLFCDALFGNEQHGYQPLSGVGGAGRFDRLLTRPLEGPCFLLDRSAFVDAMIHRNQVFLGAALFRRRTLETGGLFDPGLFGGEDYEICLRHAATHRFAFVTRPLARYEKHPGGLSANPDRMAREFALALLKFTASPAISAAERRAAFAKYRALAFGYGYRAYDRGDYREARARFAFALHHGGFSLPSALFWLACRMPGPMVRFCRRFWQGLHR
jgi:glycosyltransferase involved in cell wall biosynthesis